MRGDDGTRVRERPADDPTAVLGRRVCAYLIDGIAILLVTWASRLLFSGVAPATWDDGSAPDVVATTAGFATTAVIYVVLQGRTGYTLGKRLLNLRTVREDGQMPGMPRAFVRSVLLVGAYELPWGWLPLVAVALLTRGHRRVGDMVARTYVVDANHAGSPVTPPERLWSRRFRSLLRRVGAGALGTVFDRRLYRMTAGATVTVLVTWSVAGVSSSTAWSDLLYRLRWPGAEPRGHVATFSHDDSIRSLAFSPEGDVLATSSDDNTLRVWDLDSREELVVLDHGRDVRAVAFSPDGTMLATASGKDVWLRDAETFDELVTLPHDADVTSLAFSLDGQLAISTGDIGPWATDARLQLTVDAIEVLEEEADLPEEMPSLEDLELDPRDAALDEELRAPFIGAVEMWDALPDDPVRSAPPLEPEIGGIVFSPDGGIVAVRSPGGFRLWQARTHEELLTVDDATTAAALAFSPDGERLAAASWSHTAIWDLDQREPVASLQRSSPSDGSRFEAVAFSPDGDVLATGGDASERHEVQLWDVDTYDPVLRRWARATRDSPNVTALAFSPDGGLLASGDDRGRVIVWDSDHG